MKIPSLRSLHPESALSRAKLNDYARLTTETLLQSLEPGRPGSLKVRPDGTIIDGHHRIAVLKQCGVDVDNLPREIFPRG